MTFGVTFGINGRSVTAPDEVVWSNVVQGEALSGREKRSPYKYCEWRIELANGCRLDWYDYDNTTLASFTTTPPDEVDEYETYTIDVVCQSVSHRGRRSVATDVTARFLVYVG